MQGQESVYSPGAGQQIEPPHDPRGKPIDPPLEPIVNPVSKPTVGGTPPPNEGK